MFMRVGSDIRGVGALGDRSRGGALGAKSSPDSAFQAHAGGPIRRCRDCQVRKVLEIGFYRERTCRGGYRPECKRCSNKARARRARSRYVPKTGRRYVTEGDRKGSVE